MINITSAEGVITIVITEGEARELQAGCKEYSDAFENMHYDPRSGDRWPARLVVSMGKLQVAILKHV